MGKNKTRSKSALKQNSVTAENKRLGDDGNINFTFKILSAIGIIIIVSGHCYNGGVSLMYDWFPKYSYNLALFVFISGYFYKEKHEEHIFKYIWGRTKRLLIPAYLWNIVYGIIAFALTQVGYTIAQGKFDLYNLFVMPFIDGESFAYNLGSWFVYPLFCVYVFNILFRKLLKKVHRGNEYVILAVYLAIGIFGVQYCIWNPAPKGALLLLFRSMFFLPCFEFGRFYHEKLEKHDNLNSVAYFAIVLGVQLLLLTFCENLEYTPSKCVKFDNGCVIPYVTAITGIAFWLRVAKLITPIIKNKKLVRMISDNTYSIMIHHIFAFMIVKWAFRGLSVITPLFKDFDILKLKSTIWYIYRPNGLNFYCIIYLAAGIFIPILIGTVTHRILEFMKEHTLKSMQKSSRTGKVNKIEKVVK